MLMNTSDNSRFRYTYQDYGSPSEMKEPRRPIQIEGEDECELDEIMDTRLHDNKLL